MWEGGSSEERRRRGRGCVAFRRLVGTPHRHRRVLVRNRDVVVWGTLV